MVDGACFRKAGSSFVPGQAAVGRFVDFSKKDVDHTINELIKKAQEAYELMEANRRYLNRFYSNEFNIKKKGNPMINCGV